MSILIVGNILKDVYLRMDSRTESFELDKHGVNWLELSFNAKEHHFYSRFSSYGGAAVSLEVLNKLGLTDVAIHNSDFAYTDDGPTTTDSIHAYRYILTNDDNVSYLVPSEYSSTDFTPPTATPDYLFIDRSAELTSAAVVRIQHYLDQHETVKLILYIRNLDTPATQLIPYANLIFFEDNDLKSELLHAPASVETDLLVCPDPKQPKQPEPSSLNANPENVLSKLTPEQAIFVSETDITYQNFTAPISVDRIDTMTHLSVYSTIASTILGSLILDRPIEEALILAKLNVENSTLNSTLSSAELQNLFTTTSHGDNLELIAASLMMPQKGILAADESGGSIAKKFAKLKIQDTFENRHAYRNIFFTAKDIEKYLSGVILFDETARDYADNGQTYIDFLTSKRIIPGIKVDQGLIPLTPDSEETITQGLDGLPERLKVYYQMGLRFAKWRAAFTLTLNELGEIITPSHSAIRENCKILADYAKKCQSAGLVPIVEPELVYDGYYNIEKCSEATGIILDELFLQLANYGVNLRACILKVNMIQNGKKMRHTSTPDKVAQYTSRTLHSHVPRDLAGIVFLSGGQTPDQATANLASIVSYSGKLPWPVTFSFARALQDPALFTWKGRESNIPAARQAFHDQLEKTARTLNLEN